VPWWYAEVARELPEAAPGSLLRVADELYFMLYGDDREPDARDVARLFDWIQAAPVFSRGGRVHIVLATYQFPSTERLEAGLRQLHRLLASRPNFAGTAVFHAGSASAR
jgi:hypothetical protein